MGEKKSKSAYIKWLPVCILLLAFIAVIIWTAWCDAQQEAEWGYELNVIQSIIENIVVYQDEIESWGYQMSVLTPERLLLFWGMRLESTMHICGGKDVT